MLAFAPATALADQTAAPCTDAASAGPKLHVIATGAHSPAGNVTFTLYGDDPARFLKGHGSIALIRVPITRNTAEACFAVSAPGAFAVAIYHDENNNHHLDRNFLGLPSEGYGFSNDAPTYVGPPGFTAAKIAVNAGDNTIRIRLRY